MQASLMPRSGSLLLLVFTYVSDEPWCDVKRNGQDHVGFAHVQTELLVPTVGRHGHALVGLPPTLLGYVFLRLKNHGILRHKDNRWYCLLVGLLLTLLSYVFLGVKNHRILRQRQ